MHNIKDIRQNPDLFMKDLNNRFIDIDLKKIGSWIGSIKRYVSNIQQEVSELGDDNLELKTEETKIKKKDDVKK